jgi:hypothetical protein
LTGYLKTLFELQKLFSFDDIGVVCGEIDVMMAGGIRKLDRT